MIQPEPPELQGVVTGMVTASFLIAALFFLRFWRQTRDSLFRAFAAAFLLLGISNPMPLLTRIPGETQAWVYLPRLLAFLLIIWAVMRKNMEGKRR